MKSKKKVPPAVIRYRKSHPVIGFVLTAELKTLLDERRGNLSYGKFVKKLLAENLDPYKKGYELGRKEGYNAGFEDGKLNYEICFNCSVCGEPITIEPNDDAYKRVIVLMKEEGWGHVECIDREEKSEGRS